jgi:hypothetical protein
VKRTAGVKGMPGAWEDVGAWGRSETEEEERSLVEGAQMSTGTITDYFLGLIYS